MSGPDIPKQRGIYSEILTTEDTENLKVSFFFHVIIFADDINHRAIIK